MSFGFNAREVYQIAIEIEKNGLAFYEKAQSKIDDPEVIEIFKDLASQEVKHKERFEQLKADLPAEAASSTIYDPDNELNQYLKMMADEHVFSASENMDARLAGVGTVEDALRLAIEFEKDSIIFFLTMKDATEEGKGREKISQLIKEEQEHLRRLSLQLRRKTMH